jgi:hypothetical protein
MLLLSRWVAPSPSFGAGGDSERLEDEHELVQRVDGEMFCVEACDSL